MNKNLNLNAKIIQHLDTAITKGDGPEASDLYEGLYLHMRKGIAKLNAAVEATNAIDPDVPEGRRRERQRTMVLEAKGLFEAEMVEPLNKLEKTLEAKEGSILENAANSQPKVDPVISEMKAQETRRLLLNMDEAQRIQVLLEAAKHGKKAAIDAVRDSLLPILPADAMERVDTEYLTSNVPTLFMVRNQNRESLLQAKERINRVSRGLLRAFKVPLSASLPEKRPE